jgi:predicted nucleic acid-binding Zn finger protein
MSLYQYYKAKTIIRRGWIKRETDCGVFSSWLIEFPNGTKARVMETPKGYSCDCKFWSAFSEGKKDCVHIKAVKMLKEK